MAGPVTVIRLTDGARYDSMVAAARDHWITDGAIANAIRTIARTPTVCMSPATLQALLWIIVRGKAE